MRSLGNVAVYTHDFLWENCVNIWQFTIPRPHVPRGKPQPSPTSWSPKGARTRGDIDERGLLLPGDRAPGDTLRDLLLGEDCLGETGEIWQAGCGESLPPTSFSLKRPAPMGHDFQNFIGFFENWSHSQCLCGIHPIRMGHCHWTPTWWTNPYCWWNGIPRNMRYFWSLKDICDWTYLAS